MSFVEQRGWQLYFAIFKNSRKDRRLSHWFAAQIAQMKRCWEKRGEVKYLALLEHFCEQNETLKEAMEDEKKNKNPCIYPSYVCAYCFTDAMRRLPAVHAPNHAPATATTTTTNTTSSSASLGNIGDFVQSLYSLKFETSQSNAYNFTYVSKELTAKFGYSMERFEHDLKFAKSGFLPWGGDVLSCMLWSEDQILNVFSSIALQFSGWDLPCEKTRNSSRQVITANIVFIKHADSMKVIRCILKGVYEEVLKEGSLKLIISLGLELLHSDFQDPPNTVVFPTTMTNSISNGVGALTVTPKNAAVPVLQPITPQSTDSNSKLSTDDLVWETFEEAPVDLDLSLESSSNGGVGGGGDKEGDEWLENLLAWADDDVKWTSSA